MSLVYLLDTNILSEVIKKVPDINVLRRLELNRSRLATAAPVWNELLFGCRRLPASKRRIAFELYLFTQLRPSLPILPYDEAAASWHAEERARLEAKGRTPPFIDGQVAAIAAVNGLILVTRNLRDFKPFQDLRLESWHSNA